MERPPSASLHCGNQRAQGDKDCDTLTTWSSMAKPNDVRRNIIQQMPTPHILGTFTTMQSLYNTLPVTQQHMENVLHFLVGQILWKCHCAPHQPSNLKSNKEINTVVQEVEGGGWRELSQSIAPSVESKFGDLEPMKTRGTEVPCAMPVLSRKKQEGPEAHWPSGPAQRSSR